MAKSTRLSGHTFYKGITILNKQEIAPRHSKYQPFIDHLEMVAGVLNDGFRRIGIPLAVTVDATSERKLRGRDSVNRFLAGDSDGTMHGPQIETFLEALENVLTAPTQNISVNGVTQCGKTGTSNCMYFLGPIMFLLQQQKYATMLLTINRKSSYDQTNNEFERWVSLYGEDLVFYRTDGKAAEDESGEVHADLTYTVYWEQILRQMLPRELGLDRPTDLIRRRSPGRSEMREIERIMGVAKAQKVILAMLVDETHFGSETGGIQAKIFRHIDADLKSITNRNIFIAFSATNWEICNLLNFSQVYHRLGDTYCGFNVFNGRVVDPTANVRAPRYLGISAFQQQFGIERMDELRGTWYADEERFRKNAYLRGKHRNHNAYQSFVVLKFAEFIHWALGVDTDHPAPNPQHGKGVALRFCRDNSDAAMLADQLRLVLDPSINVIEYFGGGNAVRVKEAIERRPNRTGAYVVIMTAAGRLADSFPAHCAYFIDLTHATQNYTALMQGTVGRATGYNKNSLIVLSDLNADALGRYVALDGSADAGRVGVRVIQPAVKGRPRTIFHLDRSVNDGFVRRKFDRLQKELNSTLFKHISWPLPPNSRQIREKANNCCGFWDIFDEKTMAHIEEHCVELASEPIEPGSIQLLRFGEQFRTDDKMHEYHTYRGVGTVGLHRSRRTGSHSTEEVRIIDSTKAEERRGVVRHRPQIHYNPLDGAILSVSFRCKRGFYVNRTKRVVSVPLPSSKSHMKDFADAEMSSLIDSIEASS